MRTNLQVGIEQQRAVYETLARPLLAQLAEIHDITIREFASIFGISKSHAEEVLNHKTFPSLELAIRIARYWEVRVEDLFGWRLDDDGLRGPLIVLMKDKTGKRIPLSRTKSSKFANVLKVIDEMEER